MFMDEVVIRVKGGNGGDGCVAFLREKYRPWGGPAGGDGGRGGDVILVASRKRNTLYGLIPHRLYSAQNGANGRNKNCSGRKGDPLRIDVPPGTIAVDVDTGEIVADLIEDGQQAVVAKGGNGGRGNQHFATPQVQSPRKFEYGEPGEEMTLRLELKLIADIGLVGLPNAGKSTLLSCLSAARPKIAAYPFTTLEPMLGIVDLGEFQHLVLADIPGIIEGASQGAGLGLEFLKHIERTRALLHVVDLDPVDGSDPVDNVRIIRNELRRYSEKLANRNELIAGNKSDLPNAEKNYSRLCDAFGGENCMLVSAAAFQGLDELKRRMFELVQDIKCPKPAW